MSKLTALRRPQGKINYNSRKTSLVYVTGEIDSIERFSPGQQLTGNWTLEMGSSWVPIQGWTTGELGTSSGTTSVVFQAPIDLHLSCSGKFYFLVLIPFSGRRLAKNKH